MLAYLYNARKGPALAGFKWHDQPGAAFRHDETWLIPARLLHGNLGVAVDSDLDHALRRWATEKNDDPEEDLRTPEVRQVERKLLALMREHDLKVEALPRGVNARELSKHLVRWTDDEGRTWIRLKGWEDECNSK